MKLLALPAFTDNYIWMLHDDRQGIVVDPGDASVVREAMAAQGLSLAGILVTHHHHDHVGGLAGLRELLRGPVHGPAGEAIPEPLVRHRGGDRFELLGCEFEVIDVPGHTAGHIAFVYRPGSGPAVLFCGDTLFSGGCGRLFEGSPAQMHESLAKLTALPGETRVCCAHEYTLSNLRFARAVEADNQALADYTAWCEGQRARDLPTLPSSVATELAVNPFLRCTEAGVVQSALSHGAVSSQAVDVLAALRSWKNEFR